MSHQVLLLSVLQSYTSVIIPPPVYSQTHLVSFLITLSFSLLLGEHQTVKTADFSETIEACDLKVGRYRQLVSFLITLSFSLLLGELQTAVGPMTMIMRAEGLCHKL